MSFKVVRSSVGVWMAQDEEMVSVSRMIAIDAMRAMGLDPNEWRLRDEIISAICQRVDGTLDSVAQMYTKE